MPFRIEIPPRYGWRVEFWWQLEQADRWLYRKLAAWAGDPDMVREHWFDWPGCWFYQRRKAAERARG